MSPSLTAVSAFNKTVIADKAGEFSLLSSHCQGRRQAEAAIADCYQRVYNTSLTEFLPLILCLQDQGVPLAASGLRPGHYRPLFLEQYLEAPVEQQVAAIIRRPVNRTSLVEIGNFAVMNRGYSTLLLAVLAISLVDAGYHWAVFTATQQVERLLKRLGFEPQVLAAADPHRLQGDASLWGSYYQNRPRVMVGNLSAARELIHSSTRLRAMIAPFQGEIAEAAVSLADYRRLLK